MSDYLWDKRGKADPEIRAVERLLGRFAESRVTSIVPAFRPPRRGGLKPATTWGLRGGRKPRDRTEGSRSRFASSRPRQDGK